MPNALARETSPYLLQHAHNPVDWLPWGAEALERARTEDRPILLSIGYSSCHWCHVMERESFEDEETAALMNEAFVNVKVDREERPDLDAVYMRAVQALTGRGGWPLTVFLTPGGEPYYGGTYFPPEPRHGMPSFRQVLQATLDAWRERRGEVTRAAGELRELLERSSRGAPAAEGTADETSWRSLLRGGYRTLASQFDPGHGGFGDAPKFPQPLVLEFLLTWHRRTGEAGEARQAREMVLHTLRSMARGGMRDHLGGGFHRYSVDARWLVPHFEKMLYDNALLARVYGQAWQITGEEGFRRVATSTLDWLLEDMRSPEGGFYAARDADSEDAEGRPEEGAFYVWTPEELREVLDEADARLVARVYDVSPGGNFEGKSILHLPHDVEAVARSEGVSTDELEARLSRCRAALQEARARRPEPFRDTKVLAGWNGLALRALAEVGGALGRDDYVAAAVEGVDFLLGSLRRGDGRLLRVWTDGEAKIPAFLEDVGGVGNALVSVWEATLDPRWLPGIRWACAQVLEHFRDPESGRLFDTAHDAETLVVRPRDVMDSATPSGTSLAAGLLLRGGRLLGEDDWVEAGRAVLEGEREGLRRAPTAFGRLLTLAAAELEPPVEVALVGEPGSAAFRKLHRTVLERWSPHRIVAGAAPGAELPEQLPLLEGRGTVDGTATAYVCRELACRAPVTTVDELARELESGAEGDEGGG